MAQWFHFISSRQFDYMNIFRFDYKSEVPKCLKTKYPKFSSENFQLCQFSRP